MRRSRSDQVECALVCELRDAQPGQPEFDGPDIGGHPGRTEKSSRRRSRQGRKGVGVATLQRAEEQVLQPGAIAVASLSAALGKDDQAWIERVRRPAVTTKRGGSDA